MDEPIREDFASFYTEHASFLRHTLARRGVRAADLDDVSQEAFVAAHRNLPAFEGRSSLRTWLTAIAWRTASSYHKRSQRHQAVDIDDTEPVIDLGAANAFENDDLAACAALEPELRDLFLLHDVGGLSVSELSTITGRARATIRLRLEQGRALVARGSSQRPSAPARDRNAPHWDANAWSGAPPRLQLLPNGRVCFSHVGNVLVHLWSGPTPAEYLKLSGDSMEALLVQYPEGILYLNVLEASSAVPTREGRQMNGELARQFGHKLRAVSFSIESSTLMRLAAPILNAYMALERASINIRFFNALTPATQWLAQHGATEPDALVSHVTAMRASLDQARRD